LFLQAQEDISGKYNSIVITPEILLGKTLPSNFGFPETKMYKQLLVNISKNQKDLQNDSNGEEDEDEDRSDLEIVGGTKAEWVFLEDPTSEEDPFYWNSVTGEMRLEPPSET